MPTESTESEKVPKLFGLRYHQLIAVLLSLVTSTQLYSWMAPFQVGEQDIRLFLCLFVAVLGPMYCVAYRKEAIDFKSIWPGRRN